MRSEIKKCLEDRAKQGLLRNKKRKLNYNVSFTSNDFLDLKTGSGSSRLLMDDTSLFDTAEELISKFKSFQDSLIFSSGYSANVGLLSSFSNIKNVEFFIDRLSHASIIDGVLLSGHKFNRFLHADMDNLCNLLEKASKDTKKIIVTESIFSMDGDIADLKELIKIKNNYNAFLIVDDAHSTGIYGKNLAGCASNYSKDIDAVLTTFGKGMGLMGAAVSADSIIIEFLVNFARAFIYSTAMSPSIVEKLNKVINDFMDGKYSKKAQNVINLSTKFREELNKNNFDTGLSNSHIIPLILKDTDTATYFYNRLAEKGFLSSLVRPPTVPKNTARLRFVVNAKHNDDNISKLIDTLISIREER